MRLIPESVRKLWNGLEIRLLVLLSLTLQILLIFFAAFRKRSANKFLSFLLWACYLGAEYVATLALGILLSKQFQDSEQGINGDLVALWAPFLLLHLGGPDAITSYALEDNELWRRHLLGLVVQVSTAVLAFLLSLPNPGLWQSAIAVFISGFWKYAERTWALSAASMDILWESMLTVPRFPNYAKFMQKYSSLVDAGLQVDIVIETETKRMRFLSEIREHEDIKDNTEVIIKAHELFTTFKRLAVDLMLSSEDRFQSQYFFFKRSAFQAFRVVEIELSFLYDILYTKSSVVHCVSGFVMRFLTLCVTLSATLLFHRHIRHHSFNIADVFVTYVLLVAAVTLEAISLVKLLLSDWMIVALAPFKARKCVQFVLAIVNCSLPRKWWSNSMRQYNLLDSCVAERKMGAKFKRVMKFLRLKKLWDNLCLIQLLDVSDELKDLIFDELRQKAQSAENSEEYKRLKACRGEWVLRHKGYSKFVWSIKSRKYDESILLWHIATDLLFHRNGNYIDDNSEMFHWNGNYIDDNSEMFHRIRSYTRNNRKMCKLLSNYMVYLLMMQPAMLPAGIGKIRFQDTCAEAMRFFSTKEKSLSAGEACNMLLSVDAGIDPSYVKGDRNESVLFDACRLAKQLMGDDSLTEKRRWELISAVWVELLCHAAGNCRAYIHAKQLSLGGELLTHVWLMMAHMGIGEQYKIEFDYGRAKLLVQK